ncbi:MAG: hypothetical protein ACU84H_02430 [Gammaproteobacteria bacterium]
MPSFTSNFERDLVSRPWPLVLAIACAVFVCFVAGMELRLAQLGYQPTVYDDNERWLEERFRANSLGSKALAIIGASRIQLDLDLQVLKKRTGLEPVQLAIDGSSSYPVLASLASDPNFNGTVVVDYYAHNLGVNEGAGAALSEAFEKETRKTDSLPNGRALEKFLSKILHDHLRSYSDGATPLLSFEHRILDAKPQSQYLITLPDRSRQADYRKVPMPFFYYRRVARTLGIQLDLTDKNATAILRQKVSRQIAMNNNEWKKMVGKTRELVEAIQKKGGKVIFLGMPSSGMVREIEERRYPKALFWDYFVGHIGAPALHANYTPVLKGFVCPDGSHLDRRDQAAFSESLMPVLKALL